VSAKRSLKLAIAAMWWSTRRVLAMVGLGSGRAGSLTVLYYHAVRAGDADAFARQLDAIADYADVVDPDYIGEAAGRPKVAITFDDAFESVIDNALPLTEARRLPCTIFVPTGRLGAPPAWMMEHGAADANEVVATAETVRALADRGVRLGAHSRTHPMLTRLDPKEAAGELSGSKADLEELIGGRVGIFAFPYGDFNDAIVEIARQAGYQFVFSTQPGAIDPRDRRILRSRVSTDPSDSMLEFWLKLRGGYDWMPIASRLKRRFLPGRG
jgi:peptidoglycan/xylan/chitin deacetylase (PgdA/CDA1 family)